MLASRPPTRLSITRTAYPRLTSRSTIWLPMNPAPPVTSAVLRTVIPLLLGADFFHRAHIVIPVVVEAVGQHVIAEGAGQIADRVFDGALGLEAQNTPDLVGVDVIGAIVVRRGR